MGALVILYAVSLLIGKSFPSKCKLDFVEEGAIGE